MRASVSELKLVRQDCAMSPWLFNVYMIAVKKEVKVRMGIRFQGREESGNCLISYMQMGHFVEVCRRFVKVNAGKINVMVLGTEIHVDGV